ncbi:MAG: DsrE/DsrF/DrsH-like family protein [Deltaproteobacteria bacterium]|nr:DsrE/DsrF/DrsH-like family protein [Deltaproteobacteria bacterium]
MKDGNGVTLVVLSGDMDKVMAAFNIAIGSAAAGKNSAMFFTFWGLKAIQKGNLTGKSFFARMMGLLNRGGINRIGPSRFNFGGIGRWMFKQMMNAHRITPLEELRKTAIELGVKFMPCQMSMEVMEIRREDLIDEVGEPCGVATMLEEAFNSGATFFI